MDILNILKMQGKELYKEDLEFFISELECGDYTACYVNECKTIINNLLNWNKFEEDINDDVTDNNDEYFDDEEETGVGKFISSNIIISYDKLAKNINNIKLSKEESIIKDINFIRNNARYKENFKAYIDKNAETFTADFVEKNLSFFKSWELDQLISKILFTETFLETHYQSLDKSKIAKYQKFSESFFMKHFNDLPTSTVLKQGINDWIKKENRSSKLDVFLRLKGVTY